MITAGVTGGVAAGMTAPVSRVAGQGAATGLADTLMQVAGIQAPGGQGGTPPDPAAARALARLTQLQRLLMLAGGTEGARVRAALSHPEVMPEGAIPSGRAEATAAAVLARAADLAPPAGDRARASGTEAQLSRMAPDLPQIAMPANEAAQRYAAALLAAQAAEAGDPRRLRPGRKARGGPDPEALPFDFVAEDPQDGTDPPPPDTHGPDRPEVMGYGPPRQPVPQDVDVAVRLYGAAIGAHAQEGAVTVRISEIVTLDPGGVPAAAPAGHETIRLDPGTEVLLQLDATLEAWEVARDGDRLTIRFVGGSITFEGIGRAGAIGIAVGPVAPIVILNTPPDLDRGV